MGNSVPFSEYVDFKIARYRKRVTSAMAVVVSLLVGVGIILIEFQINGRILRSVDGHISNLLETQDRPELQRLLGSITEGSSNTVLVVQDGVIMASSRSLSDLDGQYQLPQSLHIYAQNHITSGSLITIMPSRRPNGPKDVSAKVVMISPLMGVLVGAGFAALFVLNLGLLLGSTLSQKLRRIIGQAIRPVEELDDAIQSLKSLKDPEALKVTGIAELDHIRDSILETHHALVNARDALAEKRAKELATEAYKRLIHDLHNPVAALKTMIRVSNLPDLTDEERIENKNRIPEIAEQILNQVTAAKSNLDFESEVLKEDDIRQCIRNATDQANHASPRFGSVRVESSVPNEPVIFPHDSKLLGRAVSNLVKNALDACTQNVRVVVKKMSHFTTIQVMDDGPGLAQDQVGLFLQGRAKSTKEDRQAYGLAAANHITHIHGGRIIYRKSDLGGACFEIRLQG